MILELIRNGGVLALASVALGLFGLVWGVLALASRNNTLAIITVFIALDSAGAGIGGVLYGQHQVDEALQSVESVNPVDADRIRRAGYTEARGAGLVGFAACLPALLLGTIALMRARSKPVVVTSLTQVRDEDKTAVNASGFVFVAMAGLAAVGALVLSQRPPPPAKYDFDPEDGAAWELAAAVNGGTCARLDEALKAYPDAHPAPASLAWKPAAKACVDGWLKDGNGFTVDQLLTSPLLFDEAQRAEVMKRKAPPLEEIFKEQEEAPQMDRAVVAAVVKKAMGAVRRCYERGLKKNPRLEGKLSVQFAIAGDGTVPSAIAAEPFFDEDVSACVMNQFRGLKFPAHGGRTVNVTYPVVFSLPR